MLELKRKYVCVYIYIYIYLTIHGPKKKILKEILKIYGTPLQYSCLENPMDGGAW